MLSFTMLKQERRQVEVGRFTLPVCIYGKGENILICVNGAQQSMGVWKALAQFLAPDYSVAAFDFPGQGAALINRGSCKIDLPEQINCLNQVVGLVAAKKYSILGSSWGGLIAAAFAATNPPGLRRLILASFGIKPTQEIVELIKRGMDLQQSGNATAIGQLLIDGFGQRVPEILKKATLRQFAHMPQQHLQAFEQHCKFIMQLEGNSVAIDFPAIKAQTLIINGAEDSIIDYQDNLNIASRIPSCKTILVEETGHFLHFERPQIMQYYADFLSRP